MMQGKVNIYEKIRTANTAREAWCLAKACEKWFGYIVETTVLKCFQN